MLWGNRSKIQDLPFTYYGMLHNGFQMFQLKIHFFRFVALTAVRSRVVQNCELLKRLNWQPRTCSTLKGLAMGHVNSAIFWLTLLLTILTSPMTDQKMTFAEVSHVSLCGRTLAAPSWSSTVMQLGANMRSLVSVCILMLCFEKHEYIEVHWDTLRYIEIHWDTLSTSWLITIKNHSKPYEPKSEEVWRSQLRTDTEALAAQQRHMQNLEQKTGTLRHRKLPGQTEDLPHIGVRFEHGHNCAWNWYLRHFCRGNVCSKTVAAVCSIWVDRRHWWLIMILYHEKCPDLRSLEMLRGFSQLPMVWMTSWGSACFRTSSTLGGCISNCSWRITHMQT